MNLHNLQNPYTGAARLAISHTGSPGAPAEATPPASVASGGAALLPDPMTTMMVGDPAAEIAALAVKQGQTQQQIDTKASEAEDSIEDAEDAAQVATLHDEASGMRSGALAAGILQMSAGAATIGSAGLSVGAAAGTAKAAWGAGLKGGAEALTGGGTIAQGFSSAGATDSQALATGQKALADSADRAGQTDRDAQKGATAYVEAAIDFLREYESTKAQAQAAALHGA